MTTPVGIVRQRFDRLPQRHVDDETGVAIGCDERGRLAGLILEPPHEPWRDLSNRVDRFKDRKELRIAFVTRQVHERRDVHLRKLILHRIVVNDSTSAGSSELSRVLPQC